MARELKIELDKINDRNMMNMIFNQLFDEIDDMNMNLDGLNDHLSEIHIDTKLIIETDHELSDYAWRLLKVLQHLDNPYIEISF